MNLIRLYKEELYCQCQLFFVIESFEFAIENLAFSQELSTYETGRNASIENFSINDIKN